MPIFSNGVYETHNMEEFGCLLLSNTCDMSPSNKRDMPKNVCLAPVFSLNDYSEGLKKAGVSEADKLQNKLSSLRKQEVTNLFYLPDNEDIFNTSKGFVCYLDQCFNLPLSSLQKNTQHLSRIRVTSLDYFGLYLLAIKLSFHFCRLPLESL